MARPETERARGLARRFRRFGRRRLGDDPEPVEVGVQVPRSTFASPETGAPCAHCPRTRMTLLDELQRTREETLLCFALPEEELERSYAPGKWSVRWILHHLCDAETVLYDRIRRVISEPRPVIWAFDQDAWARSLDYQHRPLALSRSIFDAVRAGVIHEARERYQRAGELEFVHSQTGVRTLREEFDKVAWHNERHLEQIRRALGAPRGG